MQQSQWYWRISSFHGLCLHGMHVHVADAENTCRTASSVCSVRCEMKCLGCDMWCRQKWNFPSYSKHMQSEFPCPGICYKPLQTGVCLRCCLWHTNSSVDVSSRMFCKWRKHTPNWISNETRSRPSFGCNSSSSLFSAVLAPHFKFWCFKEKFSTGENIHQTWVVAVLRYLSTFGCNSSFSLHLQARNQAFSYTDQQSRAISHFTEHSDKSQTFLWKTRDLLQPMKISTKHHTSTTRSQFETACRGLPFELVLVSWTRTPKVWKPLRNLERRQGQMFCCLYHAMVGFSSSIPSFPASHQQVNG